MVDAPAKHTVHTDALETLGTIITSGQARDAIHLAVEPLQAATRLQPNQEVTLLPDGRAGLPRPDGTCTVVGRVDNWLTAPVEPGEWFWLILPPRTITSLRHVWEHPAFPPSAVASDPTLMQTLSAALGRSAEVVAAETWIRNYVDELNEEYAGYMGEPPYRASTLSYDEIMDTADEQAAHGWANLTKGPLFDGVGLNPEFWTHYEIVRSTTVEADRKSNFFGCSC